MGAGEGVIMNMMESLLPWEASARCPGIHVQLTTYFQGLELPLLDCLLKLLKNKQK